MGCHTSRTSDFLEEYGKDFVFGKDYGQDVEFLYLPMHEKKRVNLRSHYSLRGKSVDEPRVVELDLNSWIGVSPGAYHFYARIAIEGWPSYTYVSNGKPFTSMVGYSYDKNPDVPMAALKIELEVMRRSDKRDVRHDKELASFAEGFSIYGNRKIGEWTYQFWTQEEAIATSVEFFKKHFSPGWVLLDKHHYSGDPGPKEYART